VTLSCLLLFTAFSFTFHLVSISEVISIMTTYQNTDNLPRPPPSYEQGAGASGSTDPLLGADRGRHSEDDIPDDFK
jgi:hypothetical protein